MVNVFDKDSISKEETYLIAPCGIYCGACDLFLRKGKKLAGELHEILDGFNILDVGKVLLGCKQEEIEIFLRLLKEYSNISECPGCSGGGSPNCPSHCPMKLCTKGKGYLTCAECDLMPCEMTEKDFKNPLKSTPGMLALITKRYNHFNIDNLKRIREIGYRMFIDEMQKKVKNGFMTSAVISEEMVFTEVRHKLKKRN